MSQAITTCAKCGCQFEWNTDVSPRMPDCPKCRYNPQRVFAHSETAKLVEMLQHGDRDESSNAAAELGRRGDREAVPALIEAMCHPDAGVAAVISLGKLRDERAVQPLIDLIESKKPHANNAVLTLFKIGTQKAVQAALAHVGEVDVGYVVREWVETGKSAPWLVTMLTSDHSQVRREAARAFYYCKDPSAVPLLIPMLHGSDDRVAYFAAEALARNGWQPTGTQELMDFLTLRRDWQRVKELGKPAIERILQRLESSDSGLSIDMAGEGLLEMGWLETAREGGVDVIPALGALLSTSNSDIRRKVVWALGNIAHLQCVPHLISALDIADGVVRYSAIVNLGKIGDPAAIEPLLSVADRYPGDITAVREALGKVNDPLAADALRILAQRDAERRRAEEERRIATIAQRKADRQCLACGKPLGFLDKLLRREMHSACAKGTER